MTEGYDRGFAEGYKAGRMKTKADARAALAAKPEPAEPKGLRAVLERMTEADQRDPIGNWISAINTALTEDPR